MATASDIADRALDLAAGFLLEGQTEIAAMADDSRVLYEAAQLVRERSEGGPHLPHSAEHLAFSLITAAHEQRRHEQVNRAAGDQLKRE